MIEIRHLSKKYRKQQVLDHIQLEIPDGSIFALLGPNGSGKTTLLKSLLGVVHPQQGDWLLGGQSLKTSVNLKNSVSYMPQTPLYPPHMKVCELVELIEALRRKKGLKTEALKAELGMGEFWHKSLGELSGGMSQKVNILCCFMFEAEVYVLDEPTAGLDPGTAFLLKGMIRSKGELGKTVVFTSHIMSEVEELADQMALLFEGRVRGVVSPDQLKKNTGGSTLEEALHLFWKANAHA